MRLNEIVLFSKKKLVLEVQALVLGQTVLHAKFSKRYILHEIIIFSQAKIKTIRKSTKSILSGTGKDILCCYRLGQF